MARSGVGIEKITEVILELESQGKEPTVTAIRERFGERELSDYATPLPA